ncbi:MAG: TIGR03435 family protein [Bryobacteraceae bacterium]
MTKPLAFATLLLLQMHHLHCQELPKTPAFEVASITPCPPDTPAPPMEHAGMTQFTSPGGRFRASATTVKVLLEWAYAIQPSEHTGGPSWINTDRYDVVAEAEGNASDDQMRLMLRTLLADRFKLTLHRERKELSAYVISVGKTAPKLFPPKDDETNSVRFAPQTGANQKIITYRIIFTRYTLQQLSDVFSRQMDSIVVNRTGLDGEYDFTLDLTPDESRPNPADPTLLMTAMREQLGLTLKSQKTPVDVLVIDSAEKVAAGN